MPPSDLSLLGLVRHMTKVERTWFRQRFAGEPVGNPFGDDAKADFERLDPARAAADYARLTEEFKLATRPWPTRPSTTHSYITARSCRCA